MRFVFATVGVMMAVAGSARATILFDSQGFESPAYTTGNLAGQGTNPWIQDHGLTMPAMVQTTTVQSGLQAVQMSNTADGTNWVFPDISYTPGVGEQILISTDIARTLGTTPNFGFLVDVYGTNGARIARWGLGNSGGAIRAILTTSTGNFLANSTLYSDNQWVHFDGLLDFATHTYSLSIDGVSIGTGIPMVVATASGLSDADLQISIATNGNDTGFFDNYVVQTVPVPGTAGLLGLGGLVALRRRR